MDIPQDVRAAKRALRRSLSTDADGPVSRLLNRPLVGQDRRAQETPSP